MKHYYRCEIYVVINNILSVKGNIAIQTIRHAPVPERKQLKHTNVNSTYNDIIEELWLTNTHNKHLYSKSKQILDNTIVVLQSYYIRSPDLLHFSNEYRFIDFSKISTTWWNILFNWLFNTN